MNVARIGARRSAYKVLVGRSDRTRPRGRPYVDWRRILKLIFKTGDGEVWTGLLWFMIGTYGGRF